MRVKRLEIQGFKSFKDKTVIHFDHSITGIVGPNGCGKSNIVDAFFWVMGEQSYKHIRGTSSEDLIFNGSTKYAPLGLAEATMVLETDVPDTENAPSGATAQDIPVHLRTKEISVTRRVYRTGEGEYFINGIPARLKDIHELFMDTGVGAKGYSVIEQGQIGKIVNAKPEERRLLIEEAAGIAKYKARKKESLRKMEATQLNLSRLNDVVQEIERNLSSLERQAQKARKYKEYKDELLDKEMTWGRRKTLVLRQKLDLIKKDRDVFEQDIIGLKAELQIVENSIETDRVAQLTDTKTAEDLQLRIQDIAAALAREQSSLDLSRKRQGDLASQLSSLDGERAQLEISISEETEKLSSLKAETEHSESTYLFTSEKAQKLDEEVRTLRTASESARRALDLSKRELMTGIAQSSDLTSRAAALLSRVESAQAQSERLRQQSQTQLEKVDAAREEAAKTQESHESVRAKRDALQAERKDQSGQVQILEQSLRQAESGRDDAARALTQVRSRLQSLEELSAAYEGFADGPKTLLDWARAQNLDPSKLGAIADAYDVAPGYEAALEGWLEGRLESLVSSDPSVALEALNQIHGQKQGRAAIYLPRPIAGSNADLQDVRPGLEVSGFEVLGELGQFIRIHSNLGSVATEAAARMISQVCVVRSLDALPKFIAQGGFSRLSGWSIVSLDGGALDSTGVLRGGSIESENSASLLGRKRSIQDLRTEVGSAEEIAALAEKTAFDAKQAFDLSRARLTTLQAELQTLEVQSAAFERDVHQMARALRDAESQHELIEFEIAEMGEAALAARSSREEVEGELSMIVSRRASLEAAIVESETALVLQESAVREQEASLQALRVDEAQLRERSSSIKRELEAGQSLIADRSRRLEDVTRVLDRATREREQFTGGDADLAQKIDELTHTLATHRAELGQVKDRLEQSNSKLNGLLDRIKELHSIGDQKTADSNQLALDIEKFSGELSHLIQNLEEKYGPGCLERPVTSPIQEEMTEPVVTAEMSAEEEQILGQEVEQLRERMRRLGEVNPGAVEEYEELDKRYQHLMTEKSDLEHSIQNLMDAIDHINKTSEDRFKKAFDAIADRFERLFPIIFGGGQAKLSLTYPEGSNDVLEAGVDILAQPPGKKIVNITLLSGGEKALTAVSLIFAIFMVKPSPFCVLDEVDAPLDDANIGKFNALLKEMSVKSQFILITHNKKTMELNDTLYGVTMEEPGVSKMVSIEMH